MKQRRKTMATFIVNNQTVTVPKNLKLMRYLRDELRLLSVKDGCSEGACGTCTVLVDGKPTKACILQTDKLEGKTILTVEGLSDFEKDVYAHAFGQAGAVQCGFCIPGMVICAKALLEQNPAPTDEEIAFALRNNICRCTGYVKIIAGVRLAAEIFAAGKIPDAEQDFRVGARVARIDAREKTLGYGEYTDDIYLEGMLHGSAVRAAHPRAIVKAIDASAALALPGVVAVYTAADIPGVGKVGHLKKDWDTMIAVGDTTRYVGDAICLVVAETQEILNAAKKLVVVDYEVLSPITSPYEAQAPGAPHLHEGGNLLAHKHVSRGDAAGAIASAPHVIMQKFNTPWTEHAFLEPECAVALPRDKGVMLYTSDQGVYDTQHEVAPMLGLPLEEVWVENKLVGGGFGGKEDMSVQHHAALCAYLTQRPVKVKLSRAESLAIHPKRHPMDMEFTLACDDDGKILGVKAQVIADTGAYASLGGPVLERACTHAAGPYNYQNFEIDGYAWYTNNPPAGAFRGFGVTQTCFAIETLLNQMAHKLNMSPWEIRYRNAIRPGQVLPNGQIVDESTGLVETLEAVREIYESAPYAGLACAMKNAGVGVGIPDIGRVRLEVAGGKVHIYAGGSCIGQGLGTVLAQIVCETTGLPGERVVYAAAATSAPDSGTTSGSRHTLITGEAARRASLALKEALDGRSLDALNDEEFYGEFFAKTDKLGAKVPNPVSHIAYGYATQVCILNEDGRVQRLIAAHDVGRAINPTSVEGQIEGGVVMSLGFALTEKYPLDGGYPKAKFGTLGLFKANQIPKVEAIIVEKPGFPEAYGAIGIGEIVSIPTAPAIADAYFKLDGVARYSLPLAGTPYERK